MRPTTALAAAAILCAVSAASEAAPIASLSATYDGVLQDTFFTVTNGTAQAETVGFLTRTGPTLTAGPITVAAGSTGTYGFNQFNGGFLTDPQSVGTPDTTQYAFSVTQNGTTLVSAYFSPLSNATGRYVDFLGNTCLGLQPCSVAQSGVVASIAASVPEPWSLALLPAGLLGLAAARRRLS